MKKFLKKIFNHVLLSTIIFLLLFILLNCIINLFYIAFREWIYIVVAVITVLGIIIGYTQLMAKSKKKSTTVALAIIAAIIIIFCAIFGKLILFFVVAGIKPEHVINKDGKKYVAYVNSFLNVEVSYYDYINPLVRGNIIKIVESYGKGGYDPFDGEHEWSVVKSYKYYDDEGNVIKSSESENTDELYYVGLDNNVKIKIVSQGSWSGKNIIQILKTTDGGKTWQSQLQTSDGTMDVHYGSKFTFINENLGYIYDPGIQGTDGVNSSLLITTDGGKHFLNEVVIIPSNEIQGKLWCKDVPYLEDGKIKLKVYTIDYTVDKENGKKTYYEFENKGESQFEFIYKKKE